MSCEVEPSADGWELLANGSSGRWDVAVEEALDREEWSFEIDGPGTYLTFQLRGLQAVSDALAYLQARTGREAGEAGRGGPAADALPLGHFGSASVSLALDDEAPPCCFIVVGPKARSTFRVALGMEDVSEVIQSLEQVVADLTDFGG